MLFQGLRSILPAHLQDSMALHLSLLATAISALFPGNRDKTKGSSSKSEGAAAAFAQETGRFLDDLNRQVSKNEEAIAQLKTSVEQLERKLREQINRSERQQTDHDNAVTAMRNSILELEARMCNGVYLWRIMGYARHLENARRGMATAVHSPPFYTSFYGYKLCLRYVW